MSLDWIPQLFKDLIGRIVPGAMVLLAAYVVRAGHFGALPSSLTTDHDEVSTALLLTGLVISYLVGLCLSHLMGLVFGKFLKDKLQSIEKRCKRERLEEHNQLLEALGHKRLPFGVEKLPRAFVMHDHIRITIFQEANRLSKMQSEIRLCRTLVAGMGILCVANLAFIFHEPTTSRIILEIVMAAVVYAGWSREFRLHEYYNNGICVMWFSLASTDRLLQLSA
jgi:hypothetical protein